VATALLRDRIKTYQDSAGTIRLTGFKGNTITI
jgi:hypothetical protein